MSHTINSEEPQGHKIATYSVVPADRDEADSGPSNVRARRKWLVSPRPLQKRGFSLVGDVALLILPVAFLALAVFAYSFNEKPISEGGKILERVMSLGPTVFPLAFAALAGRSLQNIALWNAERGSTVGTLENLHGSRSLVSALGLAISLRSFSTLTFVILLLWSLSPLGGQSSLRLLSESMATSSGAIYFPDQAANSSLAITGYLSEINQVSIIVSTSISTADTFINSSVDIWNHPKVPRLRHVETADLRSDKLYPWIDVQEDEIVSYTSLTGLGVVGLEADTIVDFTVPYAYMYTDCEIHMRASSKDVLTYFNDEFGLSETGRDRIYPNDWPGKQSQNSTIDYNGLFNVSYVSTHPYNLYYQSSFFLVSPFNASAGWKNVGYVFYGTKDGRGGGISLYKCTLHEVEVEANMVCVSGVCRTKRVRRAETSRQEVTNSTEVMLNGSQPWKVATFEFYLESFIRSFPAIGGMTNSFASHPIDNYIYGNEDGLLKHNWSTIPDKQISQRLTEVFNTYWESSRWAEATMRADPFAISSINKTTGEPFPALNLEKTTATVTRQRSVYKASLPWICTLVLCSGTLFSLGIANVIVARRTNMPDILSAVSSLTRENPYVDLPPGGSSLDGMERTRLIKNMRVQLCDVQAEEEVGRIALRSIQKDEAVSGKKVERDRLFI